MTDDFSNEDKTERPEPQTRIRSQNQSDGPSQSKVISIVAAIIVILVVLLQISSMKQQQLREIELESMRQHSKQKMEFRDKALQRRFDTIENNKQADIMESRFKSLESTPSFQQDNTPPSPP